jgi:hypothetical protein
MFCSEINSEQIIISINSKSKSLQRLISFMLSTINELLAFLLLFLNKSLKMFLKTGLLLLDIYIKIYFKFII